MYKRRFANSFFSFMKLEFGQSCCQQSGLSGMGWDGAILRGHVVLEEHDGSVWVSVCWVLTEVNDAPAEQHPSRSHYALLKPMLSLSGILFFV